MAKRSSELRPQAQVAYGAEDRVTSGALRYDRAMSGELFAQFQRFVDFTTEDKLALAQARQRLRPFLESVVDGFYGSLLQDKEAQAILDAESGRLERLRQYLRLWVDLLFCGEYDQAYFEQRARIGRTHVRVNLPQHLMFFGMSVIRRELVRVISEARLPNADVVTCAVHKLLDLELAVMNDSYREDFVDRTQAVERLQFEQRLGESEHLATIGQVAASLAHEIKNPLAGISGAIQVLGSELSEAHPHKPIIEEALRQIDRLDAAVKDLLLYARPQNPTVARCDLSELVAESMILLRQEPAFQNVRIRCEGLTERHWGIVDPSQVKQIISNILINAAHACEGDGDISCALESDSRVVRLRITDTGPGIKPDVLPRVFEPFFTTKARGTGLGLAICKRIIEAHQGVILIESRPSAGTRVTVEFPTVP